jgi:sugar lactone lactonase YvrE
MTSRPGSGPLVALAVVAVVGALGGCGESSNNAVCTSGTICTWAGTGEPAFNGDGLDRRKSTLFNPMDLKFAPDGRAYVLDWQNHRVRRVNADDTFETVIGTSDVGDGPVPESGELAPPGVDGKTVLLNHPTDVVFAPDGTMYLAAWHNHKIRHFDPSTGLVYVACGAGPGFKGDGGPAAAALMNQPKSVVIDPATGALLVLDTRNMRVRRMAADAAQTIDTVVGNGTWGFAGDGGSPLDAELALQTVNFDSDNPLPGGALALDAAGRLYIADTENHRVRRVDFSQPIIETIAGTGERGFSGDGGPAAQAQLDHPRDLEIGPDGRLYIVDSENQRIRAVDLQTGVITTVAGNGQMGFSGDGGSPLQASFSRPWGIAFDAAGNMYVADTQNNRIRKVSK